jgi:hypothetical protein
MNYMLNTSVSGFSRNQFSCHTLDTEVVKLRTTVTVNGNDVCLKCNEDNESTVLVTITLTPNNRICTFAVRN